MPFNKEDAYFIASLLAGQMPIGRGAVWLVPCIYMSFGDMVFFFLDIPNLMDGRC